MKSFLFAILVLTTVAFGQEGVITQPGVVPTQPQDPGQPVQAAPQPIPRLDSQQGSGSILVIVCDSKPEKLLVLDAAGKWIPSVQSIEVKLEIGRTTPKAICTLWSGPIKPTKPEVRTWDLAQLKSVSSSEFDQMVDQVQSDPEAIRKRLTN